MFLVFLSAVDWSPIPRWPQIPRPPGIATHKAWCPQQIINTCYFHLWVSTCQDFVGKKSHFHLTEEKISAATHPPKKYLICLFIQYEPFPYEADILVSVCIDCTKCNICNICSAKVLAANPAPHIKRFRGGPLHWYVGGEILTCEKSP